MFLWMVQIDYDKLDELQDPNQEDNLADFIMEKTLAQNIWINIYQITVTKLIGWDERRLQTLEDNEKEYTTWHKEAVQTALPYVV